MNTNYRFFRKILLIGILIFGVIVTATGQLPKGQVSREEFNRVMDDAIKSGRKSPSNTQSTGSNSSPSTPTFYFDGKYFKTESEKNAYVQQYYFDQKELERRGLEIIKEAEQQENDQRATAKIETNEQKFKNVSSSTNTNGRQLMSVADVSGNNRNSSYITNSRTPMTVSPYVSKGTYYGVLQDMAQLIGKNISDYFKEVDWERCGKNVRNINSPECRDFQRNYNRFWRDVISKEPMYEVYQKFERELIDMGIDIANIWVAAGVTIAFTPVGKVIVAGPQDAVFTLLKELNQGKSIKDPEVLVKVAAAFSSSEISAGIDTGSPLRDVAGKAVVATSFTIIKGEDNNSEILKKGAEVFLIKSIQNPVIEGILKTAFAAEKKVKNTSNNN